jgi:hypothetical protein
MEFDQRDGDLLDKIQEAGQLALEQDSLGVHPIDQNMH